MKQQQRLENIIYLVLWALMFILPAAMTYYHTRVEGMSLQWEELRGVWSQYVLLFVAFLVHNFLLAPMLVYRHRLWRYFSSLAVLMAVFLAVQCANKPHDLHRQKHHHGQFEPRRDKVEPSAFRPFKEHRPKPHGGPMGRPFGIDQHDVMATIMLILMLGMNLGIKFYFRHKDDQHRLVQLERENLEQQLEYLKYQINPHFLMNTLNNIHALVDIEPELAKESIVELSKILRYVLYEGARQRVPLNREIAFVENYIQLMRMRFTDHVKINIELPEHTPDCELPPLLLITFIENAFKHGVSYTQPSFIDIRIETADGRLHFVCRNSKVPQGEDRHGGVGLQNVHRRLDLIYPGRYTLDITNGDDTYAVDLTLPL